VVILQAEAGGLRPTWRRHRRFCQSGRSLPGFRTAVPGSSPLAWSCAQLHRLLHHDYR